MKTSVQIFHSQAPFFFESGQSVPELSISYETYGELNKTRDNAILICHYFSGNKHAAGVYGDEEAPGWWDSIIGPGKAFDTNRFFVMATDSLCCMQKLSTIHTTGPSRIDPRTHKPYARSFPVTTIADMVRAQKILLDSLQIQGLVAVAGPSMGGLQALQWGVLYPEFVKKIIPVAAAPRLEGFSAFFPLRMGIESIQNDPQYHEGNYEDFGVTPVHGLESAVSGLAVIARGRDWCDTILKGRKFDLQKSPYQALDHLFEFEKTILEEVRVRSALCDANCYIYISKANILFDLFKTCKTESEVLSQMKSDYLVISEKNDIFVTPESTHEFYAKIKAFRPASRYFEFSSPIGHLGSVSHASLFAQAIVEFLG